MYTQSRSRRRVPNLLQLCRNLLDVDHEADFLGAQSVISLRHRSRSKTKFDISVDGALRGCKDRCKGVGKSNNPYIGTEQFIGEDFVRDCVRFNRAIRLSSRVSRLYGRLRDSRMIGEFKIYTRAAIARAG